MKSPKVLYATLNWGLGHATRSIPVIDAMLKGGYSVTLASDGDALKFLHNHFPLLPVVPLPELKICYSSKNNQIFGLMKQLPAFWRWWTADAKAIQNHLKTETYDFIITDNRPTCFSSKAKNIYITHQYSIRAGLFSFFATALHRFSFKNFDEVWIPDEEKYPSLAGRLSHPKNKKTRKRYIGWLSDLKPESTERVYDIAVILSGPEPQRTWLENDIIQQLSKSKFSVCLVRGTNILPEIKWPKMWHVIDVATRANVQRIYAQSQILVCRSGYSTLMDLEIFPKPAILVPTPGQPEQEYLAQLQAGKKDRIIQHQSELNLEQACELLLKQCGKETRLSYQNQKLKSVIDNLISF